MKGSCARVLVLAIEDFVAGSRELEWNGNGEAWSANMRR